MVALYFVGSEKVTGGPDICVQLAAKVPGSFPCITYDVTLHND